MSNPPMRINVPELDLRFQWNGSHTVNVYSMTTNEEVDVFSVGDFADNEASADAFYDAVATYTSEQDR